MRGTGTDMAFEGQAIYCHRRKQIGSNLNGMGDSQGRLVTQVEARLWKLNGSRSIYVCRIRSPLIYAMAVL